MESVWDIPWYISVVHILFIMLSPSSRLVALFKVKMLQHLIKCVAKEWREVCDWAGAVSSI